MSYSSANISRGDRIKIADRWYVVASASPKLVTVGNPDGQTKTRRFTYDRIQDKKTTHGGRRSGVGRKSDYRKAQHGRRFNFHITPSEHEALQQHLFPGDKISGADHLNRLLRRLMQAIAAGSAPTMPRFEDAALEAKDQFYSFWAQPDVATFLNAQIQRREQQTGKRNVQATLGELLDRAAQLPQVEPIASAGAALNRLIAQFGQGAEMAVESALLDLRQHCSDRSARRYLLELRDRRQITLRRRTILNAGVPLIALDNHQYDHLRLADDRFATISISQLQRQLFRQQPELDLPARVIAYSQLVGYLLPRAATYGFKFADVHNIHLAHFKTSSKDRTEFTQLFAKLWHQLPKLDAIALHLRCGGNRPADAKDLIMLVSTRYTDIIEEELNNADGTRSIR